MTLISRTVGAIAAATLLLSSFAFTVPEAQAAGRRYTTVGTLDAARLQVCKVPVQDGAKFRVFGRIDNSRGKRDDEAVRGGVDVVKDGKRTSHHFSIPFTKPGRVSAAASLVVPRKPRFQMEFTLAASQYGGGGSLALGDMRRC